MDASVLAKKIGPLPVWAYGVAGGGLLFLLSRGKKSSIAGGTYAMPVPTNPNVGSITGDNGAGDGGTVPHAPPQYPGGDDLSKRPWIDDPVIDTGDPINVIEPWWPKAKRGTGNSDAVLVIDDPITDIPSIGNTPIAPSPAAGTAAGTSTKTFADSIADLAKSIGTPLAVVGNYFTADPTKKPTWSDPNNSNSVTVPGIPGMTQAPTAADLVAKSQAQIAASPTLQNQIANANVQESQRQYAVVGEGGTLVFMDPKYASYFK